MAVFISIGAGERAGPIPARLSLAGLAGLIFAVIAASPVMGQEFPALLPVPAFIASTHADLPEWRDRLLRERGALQTRIEDQRARCGNVEAGSTEEAICRTSRALLEAEHNRHIADSSSFNTAVGKTKGSCVKDQGYQLIFGMRKCAEERPSAISYQCLNGTGITEKSLACLPAIPATSAGAAYAAEAALAACGIAATVPVDALIRCNDINDACMTRALQVHKEWTEKCLH